MASTSTTFESTTLRFQRIVPPPLSGCYIAFQCYEYSRVIEPGRQTSYNLWLSHPHSLLLAYTVFLIEVSALSTKFC
jgi:hypothetical protein